MGGPRPGGEVPIRFGTSGWRGVLGDEFTFERARAVVWAVGRWVAERRAPGSVVVAHDTRFLGERLARMAVAVLRGVGARPLRGQGCVATPVAARAVMRRRAAAGIVFTASHNPAEYQGLKVLEPGGASAAPESTRRLEALAEAALRDGSAVEAPGRDRAADLTMPYLEELVACLDATALRRARLAVVYDAMHGAGAGVLDEALRRLGARVAVRRGEPDPRFGGMAPDPGRASLAALSKQVARGRGLRLGLATDGDADRYGVVDADGRLLSETEAVALLVDHLARSGRVRRGVAISIATGSLVERVAEAHGLAVSRQPIGFKYLSRALLSGSADVAGEESGGFAWAGFCRDKDGVLAGCLLAEIVATTRAPLRARLCELVREHGPARCGRTAHLATAATSEALRRLAGTPPQRVGGAAVREAQTGEGIRLGFGDGFLLLRASGTEPVVRVYAEASTQAGLERRLQAGARLLAVAGGGTRRG